MQGSISKYISRRSLHVRYRSTLTRPLVAVAMLVASSLGAIAQQPPTPSRVRGTIEAVDGDVLAVKSRSGEDFQAAHAGDMRLVGITKISLSDVKVGSFIGTTTVPGRTAATTPSRCTYFRKTCAAPARGHGRSTCARTRP